MMMAGRTEVEIQADTFVNWCSYILSDRSPNYHPYIRDIKRDFTDGIVLSELLTKLSGRPNEVPFPHPMTPGDCQDNIVYVLQVCEEEGIFGNEGYSSAAAAGIRVEDIFLGRVDGTLNLLYRLISHYDILHAHLPKSSRNSAGSATTDRKRPLPPPSEVILSWVRSFKDVEILATAGDLTHVWRDGRALYALIARITNSGPLTPPLVRSPRMTIHWSMEVAAEQLGVPLILSPDDLCHPSCDNLSVMAYLAQLRKAVETKEYLSNPYIYLHLLATPDTDDGEEASPLSVVPANNIFDQVLATVDDKTSLSSAGKPLSKSPTDVGAENTTSSQQNLNGEKKLDETGSVNSSASSVRVRFPGPPLPPRQKQLSVSKPPPQYPGPSAHRSSDVSPTEERDVFPVSNSQTPETGALDEQGSVALQNMNSQIDSTDSTVEAASQSKTTTNTHGGDMSLLDIQRALEKMQADASQEKESVGMRQPGERRVTIAHPPTTEAFPRPSMFNAGHQTSHPRLLDASVTTHAHSSGHFDLQQRAHLQHQTSSHHAFMQRGPHDQFRTQSNMQLPSSHYQHPSSLSTITKPNSSPALLVGASITGSTTSSSTSADIYSKRFKISLRGWFNRTWTLPNHRIPNAVNFPCNLLPEGRAKVAGPYWLVVTPPALYLFHRDTHQCIVEWPLNHILRYGMDVDVLSVEVGALMNPNAAGVYLFEMSSGHHTHAFEQLQMCTQLWSRRFM
eukprot:m.19723 g.19723  ORF g.19723 m.19723 type:complete len:733 (+) comp8733_c1_seq1:395-2593(+)